MHEVTDDLIRVAAANNPRSDALRHKKQSVNYAQLDRDVDDFAASLLDLGTSRHDRIAIFSGKSPRSVTAIFGASRAGCVFVPINPLLRSSQVAYLLNDCDVRVLITTSTRLRDLVSVLDTCKSLRHVVLTDVGCEDFSDLVVPVLGWRELCQYDSSSKFPRLISSDMASIMYTSGSTGQPKGVILSHGNILIGATSVATYLELSDRDRLLAVLPLSFDAGLSQLTTGFFAGATVVLHDHFLPRDIVRTVAREKITGITGVPPLWMQLADQDWSDDAASSVRLFANTGGKMPRETLNQLRKIFSNARPFLMYGLTESFRSTYLDPTEVDRRPDSIGKAIPSVEVLVVSPDGKMCGPDEVGELVHRGPLVSLGYWNDRERTECRFRPCPGQPSGMPNPELAVWSGDAVKADEEGFLYFVARTDDMIKTSGYRVSPTEIEELAFESGRVAEVAAIGVPHESLGQAIVLIAKSRATFNEDTEQLRDIFRREAPNYMMPHSIVWMDSLPRNANGKLDRQQLLNVHGELLKDINQ